MYSTALSSGVAMREVEQIRFRDALKCLVILFESPEECDPGLRFDATGDAEVAADSRSEPGSGSRRLWLMGGIRFAGHYRVWHDPYRFPVTLSSRGRGQSDRSILPWSTQHERSIPPI
jgi:hypothetical protein